MVKASGSQSKNRAKSGTKSGTKSRAKSRTKSKASAASRDELLERIDLSLLEMEFGRALRRCDKALKQFPGDADFLARRGDALLNLCGREAEAEAVFTALINRQPKRGDFYCGLAFAKHKLRDHCGAVAAFERVLELDPRHTLAAQFLSRSLAAIGKFDDALKVIQSQIGESWSPPMHILDRADLMSEKSRILNALGQNREARELALWAVKANSASISTIGALRRTNKKVNEHSKHFKLRVEGEGRRRFFLPLESSFFGAYEVAADSAEEAMDFIREVQVHSVPESLEIVECEELTLSPNVNFKGLLFVYPTFTAECVENTEMIDIFDDGFSKEALH